jgi:hypothetical protein
MLGGSNRQNATATPLAATWQLIPPSRSAGADHTGEHSSISEDRELDAELVAEGSVHTWSLLEVGLAN